MLFIIIYFENLSLACTLLRKVKILHIFAFLYTKRSRNTHLTVSNFLSVYLTVVITCFCARSVLRGRVFVHFSHGKMRGPFAMKHFPLLYTCLRWLWVTWNSHGLFGNKITAAQNLLKSSYHIMTLFCLIFKGMWSSSYQFGN